MITEVTQSRKLRKITMTAGIVTLCVGIVTSMSSFDNSGSGGGYKNSGGACWKTEVVPCNGSTTTYN